MFCKVWNDLKFGEGDVRPAESKDLFHIITDPRFLLMSALI